MGSTGSMRELDRTSSLGAVRALTWAVAALAVGSAVIHLAVVREHLEEYWLFGWFFAGVGVAQIAWAVAVQRPRRWVLWAGVVGNILLAMLWTVSRTRGIPIGPEPWHPEAVGFWDSMSTVMELLTALGAGILLRMGAPAIRATRAVTARDGR